MKSKNIISLNGITRTFISGLGERVTVLDSLNLDVEAGSFNVIRGESGSGKTTLLRILGMLDSKFSGHYVFGNHPVQNQPDWILDELRSENIGFIFQEGRLFNHMKLMKNIMLPLQLHESMVDGRSAQKTIIGLAKNFFKDESKMMKVLDLFPRSASGGEKQRASIMRAIITRSCLILADEPTASLNGELKNSVVKHLHDLCSEGYTVIVVSHDTVFFSEGRQLELEKGRLTDLL